LTLADLDYSIQTDKPTEPQIGDPLYDEKMLRRQSGSFQTPSV